MVSYLNGLEGCVSFALVFVSPRGKSKISGPCGVQILHMPQVAGILPGSTIREVENLLSLTKWIVRLSLLIRKAPLGDAGAVVPASRAK